LRQIPSIAKANVYFVFMIASAPSVPQPAIPSHETRLKLTLRLVIRRKDPEQAEAEQKRLLKNAKKRARQPDPRSLEAAKYIMLLTSLSAAAFPPADILALYRFRWQIELAVQKVQELGWP
jgi:IS4 transposase